MPKSIKSRLKTFPLNVAIIVLLAIVFIWLYYYSIGFSTFNKNNAVSIFGSVIQGMSALLSVAIAVIIFRIQTLENRKQSLEESTLNFIFQITKMTYPQWIPSVETDIKSGSLTNRYYNRRVNTSELIRMEANKPTKYRQRIKEYAEDRDTQQARLTETLNLHNSISQTIRRIKNGFYTSAIFLIMPIIISLLMFMVSDAIDSFGNFVVVSVVVLMSALGIAILIEIVVTSTVES